jgi:predicted TIM-barrel fold metal-dependent hydrolase
MTIASPSLPAGACDCHTHVIGPREIYPMVDDRHYTPGPASLEDLRVHLEQHDLQRVVIIQPSVYGTDNRCLVDSLTRMHGAARGVAVLDADANDATLLELHGVGVRGLRMNLESSGTRDPSVAHEPLAQWADRIASLGWHLQIFADLATIVALADRLVAMPVPIVLDHFAMVRAQMQASDDLGRALLDLVASGRVYAKLSAPYRLPASSQAERDDTALRWARILVEAAPDRMLWASDWPHTDREPGKAPHDVSRYRALPEDALDRSITSWLPDAASRQRVLVDNPARLYDF